MSKIGYFLATMIIFISCDSGNQTRTYKLSKQNFKKKIPIINEEQGRNGDLTWTKPASWTPSEGSSMRLASFSVPYKGGTGDLSVIQLGGEGGGLESNVNRWRRQLSMETISLEAIKKDINIQIGKLGEYSLIKIINDKTNDAFVCAIVPFSEQTLFVKLSMKANYLTDIEGDFVKFCSSLNISN